MGQSTFSLPPVYVIYCEELSGRAVAAVDHLVKMGLKPPVLWRSIHGTSFGLRSTISRNAEGMVPSPGQVGLILGHLSLWQHLQKSGIETAIVMEDDVDLGHDFTERAEEVFRIAPADWQMLFLGSENSNDGVVVARGGPLGHTLLKCGWALGTCCYAVRHNALETLIRTNQEAGAPIDTQLSIKSLPYLSWYVTWPPLALGKSGREWPSSTGGLESLR